MIGIEQPPSAWQQVLGAVPENVGRSLQTAGTQHGAVCDDPEPQAPRAGIDDSISAARNALQVAISAGVGLFCGGTH